MKKEYSIKEEAYKCSKCGLCQSVCPIYIATKNEMFLPRGRFIILNNLFNNGKKLSKEFINNLDLCLYCNNCKEFCPSNIDSTLIYTNIKAQYKRTNFAKKFKILLNLYKLNNIFKNLKKYKIKNTGTKGSIIYFEGCYNKYIDNKDKNASLELIEKAGYRIERIEHSCCGYPFFTDGNVEAFLENEAKIIENCSTKAKYIVCSCDSCYETLSRFNDEKFKHKLIRLDDLLKQNGIEVSEDASVIYHKPLVRKENCELLNKIETINKKYSCTTMENFLYYKHKEVAQKLAVECGYKEDDIKNRTIITSCNLSKLGLNETTSYRCISISEYINNMFKKE